MCMFVYMRVFLCMCVYTHEQAQTRTNEEHYVRRIDLKEA